MRTLLTAVLLVLAARPASALTSNTAGSTFQFLRIGAGARPLGMGEAYGPVAEGPEALYWNPAGMARMSKPELSYTHVEMLRFFHHDYMAYAHPVPLLRGTVGLSATLFYQDSLELVDSANQALGSFNSHAEVIAAGYAIGTKVGEHYRIEDRKYFQEMWDHPATYRPLKREVDLAAGSLSLGLVFKYISETIHTRRASAFAADGGVLFSPSDFPHFNASFVFRNAGSKPRFIRVYESLPAELSFGLAYDHRFDYDRRLIPALEVGVPYYGDPYVKGGLEYSFHVRTDYYAALRVGYKSLQAVDLGALTGLSGGFGVTYRNFTVNIGFQPMAELGQIYKVGMGWRFGRVERY